MRGLYKSVSKKPIALIQRAHGMVVLRKTAGVLLLPMITVYLICRAALGAADFYGEEDIVA